MLIYGVLLSLAFFLSFFFWKVCVSAHLLNKLLRQKVGEIVSTSILKDKSYIKLHEARLVFRFMLLYCHLLVLY